MKIEVGKTYLTRNGYEVKIKGKQLNKAYPYIGKPNGFGNILCSWSKKGAYVNSIGESEFDLVKEIIRDIKIGDQYRTRDGRVAIITEHGNFCTRDTIKGMIGDESCTWMDNGRFLTQRESNNDLIEKIN